MTNLIRTAFNALLGGRSIKSNGHPGSDHAEATDSLVSSYRRTDEVIIPIYDRHGRHCAWLGERQSTGGANIYSLDGSYVAVSEGNRVWKDRGGQMSSDLAGFYAGGLFLDLQVKVMGFIEQAWPPTSWPPAWELDMLECLQDIGPPGLFDLTAAGKPDWDSISTMRVFEELSFPRTQAPGARPKLPERRSTLLVRPNPGKIASDQIRKMDALKWTNEGWLKSVIELS